MSILDIKEKEDKDNKLIESITIQIKTLFPSNNSDKLVKSESLQRLKLICNIYKSWINKKDKNISVMIHYKMDLIINIH